MVLHTEAAHMRATACDHRAGAAQRPQMILGHLKRLRFSQTGLRFNNFLPHRDSLCPVRRPGLRLFLPNLPLPFSCLLCKHSADSFIAVFVWMTEIHRRAGRKKNERLRKHEGAFLSPHESQSGVNLN